MNFFHNMSTVNNFKKIEEEDEARFADRASNLQDSLWQTLGVFKFMGEVVDIFLPKVFDVLIAAAGGRPPAGPSASSRPRPEVPSQGGVDQGRSLKPGRPEEEQNDRESSNDQNLDL